MDDADSTVRDDAPRHNSPARRWILIIAAILLVGLALYLIGLFQGRSAVRSTAEDRDRAMEELEVADSLQSRAYDRARMWEAVALIYRTALDLEERNFGMANNRLDRAAEVLGQIQSPELGGGEIARIRSEMEGTDLRVAENLQGQRRRVLAFAESVIGTVPDEPAAPVPGDSL